MVTVGTLCKWIETLELGPVMQAVKYFFITIDPEEEQDGDLYEDVRAWKRTHPWGPSTCYNF
jgi:hypothetical protein